MGLSDFHIDPIEHLKTHQWAVSGPLLEKTDVTYFCPMFNFCVVPHKNGPHEGLSMWTIKEPAGRHTSELSIIIITTVIVNMLINNL